MTEHDMADYESHEMVPAGENAVGSGDLQRGMDVELLAAALRRDTADLDLYAKVLSVTLADSLPPGAVQVERKRSMADRMAGREGAVTNIDVALGEQRLGLRMDRGRMTGEVCKEVRGIVLSRQQVGLDEWITALARALAETAASSARAREALERFLN
jgi:regulator of protease activity HflC (stomatin/prohibitin superfamily)